MAQITSEGPGEPSPLNPQHNRTGETAETAPRDQAEPEPEQEPGEDAEQSGGMDAAGTPRVPEPEKEAERPHSEHEELRDKVPEASQSPVQGSLASGADCAPEGSRVVGAEQREGESGRTKTGSKRRASAELSPADGEPLSRMDSEDSISSTLMDLESAASSGRSTPALLNGYSGTTASNSSSSSSSVQAVVAAVAGKSLSYTCCWDHCQTLFHCSPDLAEHIRTLHVDRQRGGVFVCLWKGCKVYNTPSTSQSWLQRHMLTHSGDKPFKCVVGGCNATFASQGGLARHVPTHFSSQGSSRVSGQSRVKEESPSKAGLHKRRKMRNKQRRSLPRPHDFFDAQTMDAIRHRAICLNLATHIESLGNGHSVVFHSTVVARRKEDSGKVKLLLHWTPEDILPDVWVNESERLQQKTKVVHLSQLPTDTALLLDVCRMFF